MKLPPIKIHRIDCHGHSNESDGSLTPQEILQIAEDQRKQFAITDHNTIGAHQDIDSPWILPGVEVKVAENGVDFVVLANTRDQLEDMFRKVIEPEVTSLYGSTSLPTHRLLGEADDRGMHVIGVHPASAEGIFELPDDTLQEAIRRRIFIELNGRLGRMQNRKAKRFARIHKLPLIACGDNHRREHFLSRITHTAIPLPAHKAPTVDNLLSTLKRRPRLRRFRLPMHSRLDSFKTGFQTMYKMRVKGTATYLWNVAKSYARSKSPAISSPLPS